MSDLLGSNYADISYRGNTTSATGSTGGNYNAVFTDSTNQGVSVDDFLNLMVAQLSNQDFMNPVDDTQFVTQLAQFATMQSMQEMNSHMKTNYMLSLIGQEVTAARYTVSGTIETETGPIEKITLADNEHAVYVNGKKFTLEQIMEYHQKTETTDKDEKTINDVYDLLNKYFSAINDSGDDED